jgi:hypothetical protein
MAASQVSNTAWMLEGDYFEGCNCDIACPCIFFSDPTEGNCHVTCAWHIQKGNYGNTELNNLNVVALFNTPGNMSTGPKWKAALYITKIYSGQAGGFFAAASNLIGEMLGVKSVPIDFGIDGKRRWLSVKDTLELDIEAVAGGIIFDQSTVLCCSKC